jgi:hypothetical protein
MAATEGEGFPWYLKAMLALVAGVVLFIVVVDLVEILSAF